MLEVFILEVMAWNRWSTFSPLGIGSVKQLDSFSIAELSQNLKITTQLALYETILKQVTSD